MMLLRLLVIGILFLLFSSFFLHGGLNVETAVVTNGMEMEGRV